MLELSQIEAIEKGFAGFNRGKHHCIELDEGHHTISVKSGGNLLTFAFVPNPSGPGHQCVDILHHNRKEGMKCWGAAGGGTDFIRKPEDGVTLLIVNLT